MSGTVFDMEGFTLLFGLSIVVTVLVEEIKAWTAGLKLPERFPRYIAIILGLAFGFVLAVGTDVSLLKALGVTTDYEWIDILLTGLLLSGGSHVVYQLLDAVRAVKTKYYAGA